MLSIYQEGEKEPNLENLLGKFNENAASVVPVKPNIKMSIRSNQRLMKNNRAKRTAKMLRCEGKLVSKNGKLVPEVKCTTKQVELPKSEKLQKKSAQNNQTHLLADILSEVSKSKLNNQEEEVDKLFPREVNENNNLFSSVNNLESNNNQDTDKSALKRKRSKKPKQGSNNNESILKKKTKRKYRTIQMNLGGESPVIPNVAIKRKRRTKRAKGNKKNSNPSAQKPKSKSKSKSK